MIGMLLVCGALVGVDCGDVQLQALRRYRETGQFGDVVKVCRAYRRMTKHTPEDPRFEKECAGVEGGR